jgi:putative glycosyltransferase (TIGR04372 family)
MYFILEALNKIKIFPFYIVSVLPYAIGAIAEQISFAYLLNRKKKIIVIYPTILRSFLSYNICNKHLCDDIIINNYHLNYHRKIKILFTIILNVEFFFRRILALFLLNFFSIKIRESFFFPSIGYDPYNNYGSVVKLFEKNKHNKYIPNINYKVLSVDLKKEKILFCKNLLKNKYNLDTEKQKFICLHTRDAYYHEDNHKGLIRNVNIENFSSSIDFLNKNNYFIIRIGRIVKKKMKNNEMFLDYSTVEDQKDFLDLFLLKYCSFFISGSPSGPLATAMRLYNKPCLILNAVRAFEDHPGHCNSRFSLKKIFWKENYKQIYLKEYIKLPMNYHNSWFKYDNELIYEENTGKENLDEIKDYLKVIKFKNSQPTQKQIIFKKFLLQEFKKKFFLLDNLNEKKSLFTEMLRFKSSEGFYSQNFLKKYFL